MIVEDEDTDFYLLERALRKNNITSPVQRMRDGLEALHYLQGDTPYGDRNRFPFPEVIILDLKTPRMSGLELLEWIRKHPECLVIPTIIMSSSKQDADIAKAYELGANTYFVKPTEFQTLVDMIKSIHDYWMRGTKPHIRRSHNEH